MYALNRVRFQIVFPPNLPKGVLIGSTHSSKLYLLFLTEISLFASSVGEGKNRVHRILMVWRQSVYCNGVISSAIIRTKTLCRNAISMQQHKTVIQTSMQRRFNLCRDSDREKTAIRQ